MSNPLVSVSGFLPVAAGGIHDEKSNVLEDHRSHMVKSVGHIKGEEEESNGGRKLLRLGSKVSKLRSGGDVTKWTEVRRVFVVFVH